MSDLIERQAAIDAIIEDKICDDSLKIMTTLGEGDKAETLNMTCDRHVKMLMSLPPAQPDVPDTNVGDIDKFIDGLEEIFADFRERHVDDSVCGLCEYDGAYVGQSGDWCNECPGFDKDDCFKLSDKTRKKWTEKIIKALPSVQLATDTNVGDIISRQEAIDALAKQMPTPYTPDGSHPADEGIFQVQEVYADCIETLELLPPAQPEERTEKRTETHACDLISRQAAIDSLDVLCQEHRYKIPGKAETYSQYNEAWQDALDRAEGAIGNLPSAQPERKVGEWTEDNACEFCGFKPWYEHDIHTLSYCPNCGADMRGEQYE